ALSNGRQEGHISYKDSTVIVEGEIEPGNASIFAMGISALCVLGCFLSLLAFFLGDIFGEIPVISTIAAWGFLFNVIFIPLSWIIYAFNRKKKQGKILLTFALLILGLCAMGIVIVLIIIAVGAVNIINNPDSLPHPTPYVESTSYPSPSSTPFPVSITAPGELSSPCVYSYLPSNYSTSFADRVLFYDGNTLAPDHEYQAQLMFFCST
nr:hypothetical protein [bacterium]